MKDQSLVYFIKNCKCQYPKIICTPKCGKVKPESLSQHNWEHTPEHICQNCSRAIQLTGEHTRLN